MSFALTVRPKLLGLTNKQFQTISKRLLSQSSLKTTSVPNKQQQRYKKSVALVSGVIIVGSYVIFNQSNYFNLDTLPSPPAPPVPSTPSHTSSKFVQKKNFSTSSLNHFQQQKEGIFALNEEQVSAKLRQYEESYFVNRGKGVTRYDTCQLPSNSPIEDDRSEQIVQVDILQQNNTKTTTDWMFFGVYDGHGGWATSSKLRDQLIGYVVNELDTVYKPVPGEENLRYIPSSSTIENAISNGFLKLDHEIVTKNVEKILNQSRKTNAADLLMPALSGSCALLAFYDSNTKILKTASVGDSRAVLGRFNGHDWSATAITKDQTGSSPEEVARILSEHPNEPNVIRHGRILGSLEPSRAFGDCRYKLPKSVQERIYKQFFGRPVPNQLKTPPYVTAEPVITSTKIKNQDFVVLASDGLFEMLSNSEIVSLVVKWMEKEGMIKPKKSWFGFGGADGKLPIVQDLSKDSNSLKKPLQNKLGNGFLLEDKNVATHLIRNALSCGGSREQTSMLLSIPSPISRRYRDDLTVTVVFFDKDPAGENDNGPIEVNWNATVGGLDANKPKL